MYYWVSVGSYASGFRRNDLISIRFRESLRGWTSGFSFDFFIVKVKFFFTQSLWMGSQVRVSFSTISYLWFEEISKFQWNPDSGHHVDSFLPSFHKSRGSHSWIDLLDWLFHIWLQLSCIWLFFALGGSSVRFCRFFFILFYGRPSAWNPFRERFTTCALCGTDEQRCSSIAMRCADH